MHGGSIIAALDGVATREAAQALRGSDVGVPRSSLPKAAPDEHYWSDLVGLERRQPRRSDVGPRGRIAGHRSASGAARRRSDGARAADSVGAGVCRSRSSRRPAGSTSTGRKTIEARTRRIAQTSAPRRAWSDRRRHAVSGDGAGMRRRTASPDARCERGLWTLGVPQSARLRDRQLPDGRRPAVRRRAGDGDAGGAAGEGARRGAARRSARRECERAPVVYLSPQGAPLRHARVAKLAAEPGLVLLAGRYEGIDERLLDARGRPGDLDRRFRRVGRRIAGADADRCDRAAACRAC